MREFAKLNAFLFLPVVMFYVKILAISMNDFSFIDKLFEVISINRKCCVRVKFV
jgi:Trk-type K+ transport system membrane component